MLGLKLIHVGKRDHWSQFKRGHIHMQFVERKYLYIDLNFSEVCVRTDNDLRLNPHIPIMSHNIKTVSYIYRRLK